MTLPGKYLQLFLATWRPHPGSAYGVTDCRRFLVMLVFWPVFLSLVLVNSTCLLLDHLFFPRFRRVPVIEPVFVVGVPRSGTTFMHRLLALDDERFTTTALWELLFAPSILQRRVWMALARVDGMLGGPCRRLLLWLERRMLGRLDDVHKTGLLAPEEDYLALAPVLGCFLLILPFGDPSLWRLAYFDQQLSAAEQERILGYYSRLVQRHLYVHGQHKTFLSKNPSFTPMMDGLRRHFPDARFIGCVRNPARSVPSQISAILVGARLFSARVDSDWWREGLSEMLRYYYRRLLADLPAMAPHQARLVSLESIADCPLEGIQSLYRQFGLLMHRDYRARLVIENEKARAYRSGHGYSSKSLGVCEAHLAQRFDFVFDALSYPRPG